MAQTPDDHGRLGFLDTLTRLFRREPEAEAAPAAEPTPAATPEALGTEFEDAIESMRARVAELRGAARAARSGVTDPAASAEERAAAREARLETIHREIRADVEAMHARLGTGLKSGDLDDLLIGLAELDEIVTAGRDAHELLPRTRFAIAERVRLEAGELAIERLRGLLDRAAMPWPDPIRHQPGASELEIERARQRRLGDVRDAFLGQSYARIAQRLVGEVAGWGASYPDRGSALWEETVLEGVAAGLRAELAHSFFERLRADRDQLAAKFEDVVGSEAAALRDRLGAGVNSITEANRAVAQALHCIDQVAPELAWTHLVEIDPRARGEWDDA